MDLSPEPDADGDFAAVRTSVNHVPAFPVLHSGPSSPDEKQATAAGPAAKGEQDENIFSGLLNFMPSIFSCADPQTTPVPPAGLNRAGAYEHDADVPQLAGSESPRVPSFEARISAALDGAKLPGATANQLGGLSSPHDESPSGSRAHGGTSAPSPSMSLAERKALINERLLQARVKASRLKAASPNPLGSSSSSNTKPRVQRRSAIPGPGGSVSRSQGSKVSEVTKSINLRMSQEGLHPAPAPDFSKVRSSSELRKSGTCHITRASGHGPLKRRATAQKTPEATKKGTIVSYPSRHISGPSAASYNTHMRLSSASSHPGMVTVNTVASDKTKARTRTKTPPSRGPNSVTKRPAGGSRAGSPAVTPFRATAAGSQSSYSRGSPASGGASRLRPPTSHHLDSKLPSYLRGTAASSASHNHPAAAAGTPSPEVSKSKVAGRSPAMDVLIGESGSQERITTLSPSPRMYIFYHLYRHRLRLPALEQALAGFWLVCLPALVAQNSQSLALA